MSAKQYTQSVSYLFGADVADAVPAPLPPLARTSGLLAFRRGIDRRDVGSAPADPDRRDGDRGEGRG